MLTFLHINDEIIARTGFLFSITSPKFTWVLYLLVLLSG